MYYIETFLFQARFKIVLQIWVSNLSQNGIVLCHIKVSQHGVKGIKEAKEEEKRKQIRKRKGKKKLKPFTLRNPSHLLSKSLAMLSLVEGRKKKGKKLLVEGRRNSLFVAFITHLHCSWRKKSRRKEKGKKEVVTHKGKKELFVNCLICSPSSLAQDAVASFAKGEDWAKKKMPFAKVRLLPM